MTSRRRADCDNYLLPSATRTRRAARSVRPVLASAPGSIARLEAAFFLRAVPGPGAGVWGSGDGVRGGSLAGIRPRPIRGSPERTDLEERWRHLRRTGRLRSEPGTVQVSHRYSQRRHFAQAGESECLPGGGAKVPRPIVVGNTFGSTLI